jgi:hypothetical protein
LTCRTIVPDFNTEVDLGVVTQSAALGVLAIGQSFVIVCGLIDLSVGQLLGLIVVLSCDFAAGRPGWLRLPVVSAHDGSRSGEGFYERSRGRLGQPTLPAKNNPTKPQGLLGVRHEDTGETVKGRCESKSQSSVLSM